MVSFYPGPSKVEDKFPAYARDAFRKGILSLNHRSVEFMAMMETTTTLLHRKLRIPKDYTIIFTSSATECWEVIAQSLVIKESLHIYNGAFGEKWFGYAQKLRPASSLLFNAEEIPLADKMDGDVICVTQNETSNGTQLPGPWLKTLRLKNPDALIAVDVTSSLAGISLDFTSGDVWFASVQKCFGLPAGLAIMILSPAAVQRMKTINDTSHYNSLTLMFDMALKNQTSFTPNVMAIYLLMRTMEDRPAISVVHKETVRRYRAWVNLFKATSNAKLMINNVRARSYTVLVVATDPDNMATIKKATRKARFLLGDGYGSLKANTFRIANFPALRQREINGLMKVLTKHL